MDSLDDKVCVVAGGANGLGRAAAAELADHGARVVVNDLGTSVRGEGRDPDAAREAAEAIRKAGGDATAHAGDVADVDDARDLVATAVEEYGRLDCVANFAGILRDGVSYDLSAADWDAVVRTNLRGHFALLRAAAGHWRERAGDDGLDPQRSFLGVSSMAFRGNAGQVNYAAAKAGVLGLVRSASTELYRHGVRVNALVPNAYTRMTETVPEDHRPYTREEMPPEAVAPAVAYLASDAATDVTGCTLYAGGDRVGLLSEPSLHRVGVRPGGWSADELAEEFRESVADDVDLTRTERYF